jgi:hypothetical protein
MPSADSYATVGTTLDFPSSDTEQWRTSAGKFDRLRGHSRRIYTLALMDLDFAIRCPLV